MRRYAAAILASLFTIARGVALVSSVTLLASLGVVKAQGPAPGTNVNVIAGRSVTGDWTLQRQNEPTLACSSRNPRHCLAGANDYRTVDIPFPDDANRVTGDAWLGWYASSDGGLTWRTRLLPGFPQDTSTEGTTSPLRGYLAGADPVIRPGTNGLFYYSGIAFNRTEEGASAVFVARFIDNNNQEGVGSDPIAYLGTTVVQSAGVTPQLARRNGIGARGQRARPEARSARNRGSRDESRSIAAGAVQASSSILLDKPWIAVDVPRAGAQTCSIGGNGTNVPLQTFPGGRVYLVYTIFEGGEETGTGRVMFSRSLDCGLTWSAPRVISRIPTADVNNDGVANNTDLSLVYASLNKTCGQVGYSANADVNNDCKVNSVDLAFMGTRLGRPVPIQPRLSQGATLAIHPQTGALQFAWRQFKDGVSPDAIVAVRSNDAGTSFSGPMTVALVNAFDQGSTPTSFRTNGYPTLAMDGSGRAYLAWSTRGLGPLQPDATTGDTRIVLSTSMTGAAWTAPRPVDNQPPVGHQVMPALAFAEGKLQLVFYDLREDLSQLFAQFVDEFLILNGTHQPPIRHTMEVRGAQADPADEPVFTPFRISKYLLDANEQPLQFNPPNLPLFRTGTTPFMGDYIDAAPATPFVRSGNTWQFNTAPSGNPAFHAIWTDNRDIRPPADGNWKNYTPPNPPFERPTMSGYAQGEMIPACVPGQAGMRNQNIYTARITEGLIVGALHNTKPLGNIQRSFPVFVQNNSTAIRSYRLTITSQPVGGDASFKQFELLTMLDVRVPPKSTVARTVFVRSTDPHAQVTVQVVEITAPAGTPVPNGQQGTIVLNPDPTNPDIENPDIENPDIENPDIENPDIENPDIENPDIENQEVYNPDIENADVRNPDIENPDIENPDIENPDIENVTVTNPSILNPDIENPDIENPDIENPDIENPDIENADLVNGGLSDTTWTVRNNGNTAGAFTINLALNQALPQGFRSQLIAHKVYKTPTVLGCSLLTQPQTVLLANIPNPQFVAPGELATPDIENPDIENLTIALGPGEVARVTLRVFDPNRFDAVTYNAAEGVAPAIVSQSVNTVDAQAGDTRQPAAGVLTSDEPVSGGAAGGPYSTTLDGIGTGTWTLVGGALPPGTQLNGQTGVISGTPTTPGTYVATLKYESTTGLIDFKTITIVVAGEGGSADVALAVSATPQPEIGAPLVYTITASNVGPAAATNVTLTDTLPAGVTFVSAVTPQGTCTHGNGTVICRLGTVASGAAATVTLTVTPTVAGSHLNLARITASEADPVASSNSVLTTSTIGGEIVPCTGASFSGPATYPVSDAEFEARVQAADFNRDGRLDLAYPASDNALRIYFGDGAGGFGSPTTVTVPGSGIDYGVADFNRDGTPDLAVRAQGATLWTLLGNGSGGFGGPLTASAGGPASMMTIADLNLDGNPDVLFGNTAGDGPLVTVLLGTGDGTFQPPTGLGTLVGDATVVADDFNGDGNPDIAASDTGTNTVTIMPGTGTGAFGTPFSVQVGSDPAISPVGDLNGDSRAELLVHDTTAGSRRVLVYVAAAAGGFTGPVNVTAAAESLFTTSADLDADGDRDLITTYRSRSFTVQRNDGSGAFAAAIGFASPQAFHVQAADFNGDQRPDLAFGGSEPASLVVYLNTCDEPPADLALNANGTPGPIAEGATVSYAVSVTNNGPNAASGALLTGALPESGQFISATPTQGTCSESRGLVTCPLGSIPAGATATITVVVRAQAGGTLQTRFGVTALTSDPIPSNNTATVNTTVTAGGSTFVVTTTNDGGPGSLREALGFANADGGPADTIRFNIEGTGPFTIRPLSNFDDISQPVIIDGTTQPGYAGTPLIELSGENGAGAGFWIGGVNAANVVIRGLAINRFSFAGLALWGNGSHTIEGNFIGTDPSGTQPRPNGVGIVVGSFNNVIGGTSAAARNIIAGNATHGVLIRQTFEGSPTFANAVRGNYIGAGPALQDLGNGGDGVRVEGSNTNTIGGTLPGQSNLIAFNSGNGVSVVGGIQNRISTNSIFNNDLLGIDLGANGVTANDAGDADTGPNNLQNFPVIASAASNGVTVTVQGTLDSTPNTVFRIELFNGDSDPSGFGEGADPIGALNVTTAANGQASFSLDVPAGVTAITATASHPAGNTSEFSARRAVTTGPQTLVVTSTSDSGPGTLRQAILTANATVALDTITFNIPGTGPHTITLASGLPAVSQPAFIDATTQPGFDGRPIVELSGNGLAASGFSLTGGGITISGFAINGFTNGIVISTNGENVIEGNFIGTDVTGTSARPNTAHGVLILSATNRVGGVSAAARNVISGNQGSGVAIQGTPATGNLVEGNYIGTNAAGTGAVPNTGIQSGVFILNASNNTIGGVGSGARNVVSGNAQHAITVVGATANGNAIQGNFVGVDATGQAALANGGIGIDIVSAVNTLVGGFVGGRNVISGNGNGMQIRTGATGTTVQHNYIGVNATGTAAIGNGLGITINDAANGNTIGGTSSTGNLISGNNGTAISVSLNANQNVIRGNRIGTDAAGVGAIANSSHGILISGASGTLIGGAAAGEGNIIAFNGGNGVRMPSGTGNQLALNQFFNNGLIAIDLGADGVTVNDAGDADTGANNLQNYPVLAAAAGGASGTLNSTPAATFRVEYFSNLACDVTQNGEGQTFLGSASVTTDADGNAPVPFIAATPGSFVTATATDSGGNTSEFSTCVLVTTDDRQADLSITNTDSPDPVIAGSPLTYTLVVANSGPDDATDVTVTDTLPAAVGFVSAVSTIGSCSAASGTVTCQIGTLNQGASATITIVFVPQAGGTATNSATVASSITELNPANNTAIASTTVIGSPQTFVVTNTNDSGPGSLRQAILNVNSITNFGGTIAFNIPGTGPFTISPPAPLPALSESVTVDGTTQPGYTGVPLIVLNGAGAPGGSNGLTITRDNSLIRGIAINGFSSSGIVVLAGLNSRIERNLIGTNAAGTTAAGNVVGITVFGSGTVIGGLTPATRNVISGNQVHGIQVLSPARGVIIQGNYIGTDITGTFDLGNTDTGVVLASEASSVGATTAGGGNVISGNDVAGIRLQGAATANVITGNFIGVGVGGAAIANGIGIAIGLNDTSGASTNTVGGPDTTWSNTVTFNTGAGIAVIGNSTNNTILSNFVHGNGGLGIDLGNDGVTGNDAGDADTGPNELTNTPVLAPAVGGVQGTLNGLPDTTYTIQLFTNAACDASGFGEGASVYHVALLVTTDATGTGTIPLTATQAGSIVTATATDSSGNTSEFSGCVVVPEDNQADLFIEKFDTPDPVAVGSALTYTLFVANVGPDAAAAVTVVDTLSEAVTFVSATPSQGTCTGTTTVTCNLGSIASDDDATVTIVVTANSLGTVNNTAFVTSTTADPVTENNTAFSTTTVGSAAIADVAVSVTDSPDPVMRDTPLTYTVTVTNNGPQAATNVALQESWVGIDLSVVSATPSQGSCTPGTFLVTCALGTLADDASATVTIVVTPNVGGQISATVVATASESDSNTGNNLAFAETAVTNPAGTFTVTTDADSGPGSLREAILSANANSGALDVIDFNIPGFALHTIALTSPLPTITDPVVIDGSTQAGWGGFPLVELDGTAAGPNANGLVITAGGSRIRGLAINRFGTGGAPLAAGGAGVVLQTGGGNIVESSVIGADHFAFEARPNRTDGIVIDNSPNNRIGSNASFLSVISGNLRHGIVLSGAGTTGTLMLGNYIGTDVSGFGPLPNQGAGIAIFGALNNSIGGSLLENGNRIGFNGGDGVLIASGTGNSLLSNAIFSNGGLGIDLEPDGITPNDAGDGDTGANALQNFPVLSNPTTTAAGVGVTVSLSGSPNTGYRVQFFGSTACDASGNGEGETFLIAQTLTTDGAGAFAGTVQVPISGAGQFITATATANGNTSEFSGCVQAPQAILLFGSPVLNTLQTTEISVLLTRPAGSDGQVVQLTSSNPGAVTVPASVTVAEDETFATFIATGGTAAGTSTITATAEGFVSGTFTIDVALRAMTANVSPLIGIGRTVDGILQLGQPAPAGGVTITLASSATSIFTVNPTSLTIPAGATSGDFRLTGVSTGIATLTGTAAGYSPISTGIEVTGSSLISLGQNLVVAPGNTASLALSLGIPAPAGGLTITLTSGSPSIATVTPSVFIPAGLQVPAANPVITGVGIGTAVIGASATGFAPDSTGVSVTVGLSFTPASFNVVQGATATTSLRLSAPAPTGGLTVNLSTDSTAIATVPSTVTVGAGLTSANVTVTGVALGPTTLRASAPGITQTTAAVTVVQPPAITVPDAFVGEDLQAPTQVSLGAAAPAGGLTVTAQSNDSALVLLSSSVAGAGSAGLSIPIAAGGFSSTTFYVHALGGSGTATITFTAPGYASETTTITLRPSGFIINSPTSLSTNTLAANTSVQIASARLNPTSFAFEATQAVRGGASITVTVTSSNTNVGTITVSPVSFTGGVSTVNTGFDPVGEGQTVVTVGTPIGFSTPTNFQQFTATVTAPDIIVGDQTVGKDLQVGVNASLEAAAPLGGVTVTIESADPNLVLLSTSPTAVGQASIQRVVPSGTFGVPIFYVQALGSSGTVQLTATAANFTTSTSTVTLTPSGFIINQSNINTNSFAANTGVQIASARLNATLAFAANQAVRAGVNVNVGVTSSNTTVGAITISPLNFTGGVASRNTAFDPAQSGTSTIAVVQPAGFSTPVNFQQITATVTAPDVTIADAIVGRDLQMQVGISLETAPPAPVTVTVEVGAESVATLSVDGLVAGTRSVTFTNVTSSSVGSVWVQGRALGSTTLTARATGYNDDVGSITVNPSGFIINSPSNFSTNTFAANTLVQIVSSRLNPSNLNFSATQAIRGGLTVNNVQVTSSDTNAGVITTSPLTFGPNTTAMNTFFDPRASGTTVVAVAQPAGFDTPTNFQQITATVTAPNVSISNLIIGKDLQVQAQVTLEVAPPSPVTVVVRSNATSIATITDTATVAGGDTITFSNVTGTTVGTIFVQGRGLGSTTLTGQAAGYDDATASVTVDPSGFIINSPSNFTTSTFAANTSIQITPARLSPATLNWATNQSLRGGLSVTVPVVSSDPNVGAITVSPVAIAGGANAGSTAFNPANQGTATISIGTPAGFSTPSSFTQIVATVTAPPINVGNAAVGRDLQVPITLSFNDAPPAPVTVTIQSNSTATATLSTDPLAEGGQTVTFPNVSGTQIGQVYVQGRNVGGTTLSFSAPGYGSGTSTVTVNPSGFIINSPSGSFSSSVGAGPTGIQITPAQLDPATLTWAGNQSIRGGRSVNVSVTSSNPAVGTISPGTVSFPAGSSAASTSFTPLTIGETTIMVPVPAGFSAPANFVEVVATIGQ